MKKTIFLLIFVLLSLVSIAFADYGSMMGYGSGMMGGGIGMGSIGLIYFALVAFIFSVIFWLTRNWLVKKKKR